MTYVKATKLVKLGNLDVKTKLNFREYMICFGTEVECYEDVRHKFVKSSKLREFAIATLIKILYFERFCHNPRVI